MTPLGFSLRVVAAAGAVLYNCFFANNDDVELTNSPTSPSRSTRTTSQLRPSLPPDTYFRGQTNSRTPATPLDRHDFYQLSRTPSHAGDPHRLSSTSTHAQPSYLQPPSSTRDYAYHSVPVSPHAGEAHETPRTSTRAHASHPPLTTPTRVSESTVSTIITASVSPHAGEAHDTPGSSAPVHASPPRLMTSTRVSESTASTITTAPVSPHAGGAHETPRSSAPVHTSHSPLTTSTRVSQSTVSTITTADHIDGVHPSSLAPPYSHESHPIDLAPSPAHVCIRSVTPPDATIVRIGHPESPSTSSGTLSSSFGSGYLGTTSSTRVIPLTLSRVPNARHGVKSEADTTAEDMKAAKELRKRARRNNREMREARDSAKSARKCGDYTAEQKHRQDAIAYESEMNSQNKRAAKIFFRENNKALPKGTTDLHGLYIQEALEYAKKELQSAVYRNDDKICFITGQGLHSDGGLSKIRPRLAELCDQHGFTYSLDPQNAGKLIVQLN